MPRVSQEKFFEVLSSHFSGKGPTKPVSLTAKRLNPAEGEEPLSLFRLRIGSGKHVSIEVSQDRVASFQHALAAIIKTKCSQQDSKADKQGKRLGKKDTDAPRVGKRVMNTNK
jgi:hypothetical protein